MSSVSRAAELLDQLQQERQKASRAHRLVAAALVGLIALFIVNVCWQVQSFDGDAMLAALEIHATTTVWPTVSAELEAVGEEALPAIADALATEANALLVRATEELTSESEIFQQNVGQHMHRSLEAAFVDASTREDAVLDERLRAFSANPDVHEELLRRLQSRSRQWAEQELDTTFAVHVQLLNSINETVQVLVRQAGESKDIQGQTPEDVLMIFIEIMNSRLGGEG